MEPKEKRELPNRKEHLKISRGRTNINGQRRSGI